MVKSRVNIQPQKILSSRAIELLEDFTVKGGSLEWRNAFEDLIAELDINPDYTSEAKALFGLELLLHEADDGLRDVEEAYTFARDLIEAERAARCVPAERRPNPSH